MWMKDDKSVRGASGISEAFILKAGKERERKRNLSEQVYITIYNLLIYFRSRKKEENKRKGKEFIGTG